MPLNFPSNPVNGQVYDNFYWNAAMSAWRASGEVSPLIPAGIISQYAGTSAPSGYLMCNGQSVGTADFPALFAAIGYQYGGSGANFSIPDLQNRVPVGKGSETEFDTLGKAGGSKTHTLTVNEMPSHTHIQDAHNHTQNPHNHQSANTKLYVNSSALNEPVGGAGSSANTFATSSTTATNNAVTATNQNTGGGLAHNNLQPYIVLNYIIKT